MFGACSVGGDERQIDIRGGNARQLDLRLFRRLLESLHRHLIAGKIDARLLTVAGNDPFHDALVKIVAAEAGVAVGRQHFKHAVADVEDGNVERAAAEVIDHDLLLALLIDAVGERRGGRLVDDTQHLKARDLARVLGRLALTVVKVRRNGDNRLRNLRAEIALRIGFQFLQNHRRDLLRRIALAVDLHFVGRTHLALDGDDRAVGIGDRLALRRIADETLARLAERDDRRGRPCAFGVGDDDRVAAFHNRYAGVCRSEVNTDNFSHMNMPPFVVSRIFVLYH